MGELNEKCIARPTEAKNEKFKKKGALSFPMYKPVFHNGTKKTKVVIDCESSKRLVHIYGVDEIKKLVKQNCGMDGQSGFNLVIVYPDCVCNTVNLVVE